MKFFIQWIPINEKLGKQAAEYAKQYAWEKIATKLLEVISEVINTYSPKSKTLPGLFNASKI